MKNSNHNSKIILIKTFIVIFLITTSLAYSQHHPDNEKVTGEAVTEYMIKVANKNDDVDFQKKYFNLCKQDWYLEWKKNTKDVSRSIILIKLFTDSVKRKRGFTLKVEGENIREKKMFNNSLEVYASGKDFLKHFGTLLDDKGFREYIMKDSNRGQRSYLAGLITQFQIDKMRASKNKNKK